MLYLQPSFCLLLQQIMTTSCLKPLIIVFKKTKATPLSFPYMFTIRTISLLLNLKDTENSVYNYVKESKNSKMHIINGNHKQPRDKTHLKISQINKGNSDIDT